MARNVRDALERACEVGEAEGIKTDATTWSVALAVADSLDVAGVPRPSCTNVGNDESFTMTWRMPHVPGSASVMIRADDESAVVSCEANGTSESLVYVAEYIIGIHFANVFATDCDTIAAAGFRMVNSFRPQRWHRADGAYVVRVADDAWFGSAPGVPKLFADTGPQLVASSPAMLLEKMPPCSIQPQ